MSKEQIVEKEKEILHTIFVIDAQIEALKMQKKKLCLELGIMIHKERAEYAQVR